MKQRTLFANGCSFTWGGGLDPWFTYIDDELLIDRYGTSDMTEYWKEYDILSQSHETMGKVRWDDSIREKMVWPHFLGELMEVENVVNSSMGCGSNNRILRTTLEWLTTQDSQTLDNTFAVIQLTEPSRYEYYEPYPYDHWVDCKIDHCGTVAEDPEFAIERNNLRLSTFTPEEAVLKFITECTSLHQMFTHFNVDYRLCCLDNPFVHLKEVRPEMENFKYHKDFLESSCKWLADTIRESSLFYITNPDYNPKARNLNFSLPYDAHYSEHGNQLLAKIMYEYIIR